MQPKCRELLESNQEVANRWNIFFFYNILSEGMSDFSQCYKVERRQILFASWDSKDIERTCNQPG